MANLLPIWAVKPNFSNDPEILMTQNLQPSLEHAVDFSRQMLASAKLGEWQKVADLESQRQKSLPPNLQQAQIAAGSSDGLRIQEIIKLDREIQQLLQQARESVREDLLQLNKVRTAAKAYIASQ